MGLSQRVTLPWGGEARTFFLGIGQLRALQAKTDAGPEEIAARLLPSASAAQANMGFTKAVMSGMVGRYRVDDVRETILQGLIGGGAPQAEATALMLVYFDAEGVPVRENVPLAFAILMAAISGVPEEAKDEPGEQTGEAVVSETSPTAASASATSTGPVRVRASPRGKSTK